MAVIQGHWQVEAPGVHDPAEAESQISVQITTAQPQGLPIQRSGCHSVPFPSWAQDHSAKPSHRTSPRALAQAMPSA